MICRRLLSRLSLMALLVGSAQLGSAALDAAHAQSNEQRIAAIVNDEVISAFDVEQRLRLVVSSSGARPSQADLDRLEAQVVRTLVDEKLQWQEARRLEVEIDEQEIIEQLQYIAESNGLTIEDVQGQLARDGISIFTLTDQIKVDIAWNKLIRGRFGPQVKVSEEEIDRILDDLKSNLDKPQYNVVEIFLPVDSPEQDDQIAELADALIKQLQGGKTFAEIAQQYSQSPTAANGGDLGWVTRGQLAQELDEWLEGTRRGALTAKPLRTVAGYYILGVRDTRNVASTPTTANTPLFLKRIFVALGNVSEDKSARVRDSLQAAARRVRGCETLDQIAGSVGGRVVDLGTKTFAQLPPQDQQRVFGLVSGEASPQAWRSDQGWDIIVLCGHAEERTPGLPSRDDIAERLFSQQISMLSRRYLRDLRRDAVIEMRAGEL